MWRRLVREGKARWMLGMVGDNDGRMFSVIHVDDVTFTARYFVDYQRSGRSYRLRWKHAGGPFAVVPDWFAAATRGCLLELVANRHAVEWEDVHVVRDGRMYGVEVSKGVSRRVGELWPSTVGALLSALDAPRMRWRR